MRRIVIREQMLNIPVDKVNQNSSLTLWMGENSIHNYKEFSILFIIILLCLPKNYFNKLEKILCRNTFYYRQPRLWCHKKSNFSIFCLTRIYLFIYPILRTNKPLQNKIRKIENNIKEKRVINIVSWTIGDEGQRRNSIVCYQKNLICQNDDYLSYLVC